MTVYKKKNDTSDTPLVIQAAERVELARREPSGDALAAMAEADPEFQRLLAQRSYAAFRQPCDFGDGRLGFRMRAQLFDVCLGILAAHDLLFSPLGHHDSDWLGAAF
ncbi:hypothetical protein QA640_22885 [Bradyrhizobium sp. CB82]|uniref:hypothetical protein n=1 Tax=Bradyrhizobium sp. CB82 TaxID=3039159 RepID=UPI0024B105F3|nr:hypothetical protein [Bradyrhizobium sp. CB82]WFU37341.1 hypothetical protein QA640_22885 [Bradyrhizobium sp. CB82]